MTSAIREDTAAWRPTGVALVAGIALGLCYLLSPLGMLCMLAIIPLFRWAGRGLDQGSGGG